MVNIPSYPTWLKSQVEYFTERGIHDFLFSRLHGREFYAFVHNDENRAADGLHLRRMYDSVFETSIEENNSAVPCTFLEFLIALAKRMNFIASPPDEEHTADFFWMLLTNIGLSEMTDDRYWDLGGDERVNQTIDTVLERKYAPNGEGSLFPMQNPKADMRNVEVFYQMNYYIREMREADMT